MIAGLLLAGGEGRRFGGPKLLAPLPDGTPVAVAAARHLAEGGLEEMVAVVRPGGPDLERALAGTGARVVAAPEARRGMGASLAAGVAACPDAHGWIVALGDMPWIRPETVAAVAGELRRGSAIVRPALRDRPGHPVGFGAGLRADLEALDGDVGGRQVLDRYPDRITLVPVSDPGIRADIDHLADLGHP